MKLDKFNLIIINDEVLESLVVKTIKKTERAKILKTHGVFPISSFEDYIYIIKGSKKDIENRYNNLKDKRFREKSKVVFITQDKNTKLKNINTIRYTDLNKNTIELIYTLNQLELQTDLAFKTIYKQYKPYIKSMKLKDITNSMPFTLLGMELDFKKTINQKRLPLFYKALIQTLEGDKIPLQFYIMAQRTSEGERISIADIGRLILSISDNCIKGRKIYKLSPEQLSKIHYHYLRAKQSANNNIITFLFEFTERLLKLSEIPDPYPS